MAISFVVLVGFVILVSVILVVNCTHTYFSAKTHTAFVRNVNGLKLFAITSRTTTKAVVVGSTSNSA